jgi:tight adherence protein B
MSEATRVVIFGTLAAAMLASAAALAPTRGRVPTDLMPADAPRTRRPHTAGDRDTVGMLDEVAGDVRSGLSVATAVSASLVVRPTLFPATARAFERGASLDEALLASEPRTPDETLALHTIRLAQGAGSRASDVLEQAGGVLRERRAWQHERRAQASQARLSARVLTWLPMAFAAWGIATSGRVRTAYSATPLTMWCTSAGIALNIVGWWWMKRIITGAPS